jgi:hypothetical protein
MGVSNSALNNANSINSTLTPQLQQLVSQWATQYGPQLQALISGQSGAQPGYAAGATSAAGNLNSVGQGLQNFQALTPANIAALASQSGNAVKSAGQTFAAQNGGTANPALLARNLAQQAGQASGDVATQLGNTAAQQRLGAQEGAASAYSGAGNLFSGLNSESLSTILRGLGIGQETLNTGVGGLQNLSNQYLTQQQMANASNPLNQLGSLLGGVGSLFGLGGAGSLSSLFGGGNTSNGNTSGGTAGAGLNSQGSASTSPIYVSGGPSNPYLGPQTG